jgi:hypothetical protein
MGDFLAKLLELGKLKSVTEAAIETAKGMTVCRLTDGGLRIELSADGCDVEIEIRADGKVSSVTTTPR